MTTCTSLREVCASAVAPDESGDITPRQTICPNQGGRNPRERQLSGKKIDAAFGLEPSDTTGRGLNKREAGPSPHSGAELQVPGRGGSESQALPRETTAPTLKPTSPFFL